MYSILSKDRDLTSTEQPAARQPLAGEYAAHLRVAALLNLFHLNP
jgi:hypothetical protein